jgi:hypothetical protein
LSALRAIDTRALLAQFVGYPPLRASTSCVVALARSQVYAMTGAPLSAAAM